MAIDKTNPLSEEPKTYDKWQITGLHINGSHPFSASLTAHFRPLRVIVDEYGTEVDREIHPSEQSNLKIPDIFRLAAEKAEAGDSRYADTITSFMDLVAEYAKEQEIID